MVVHFPAGICGINLRHNTLWYCSSTWGPSPQITKWESSLVLGKLQGRTVASVWLPLMRSDNKNNSEKANHKVDKEKIAPCIAQCICFICAPERRTRSLCDNLLDLRWIMAHDTRCIRNSWLQRWREIIELVHVAMTVTSRSPRFLAGFLEAT